MRETVSFPHVLCHFHSHHQNEGGRKVEETHGEFILDVERGKMFSVTQHQNNPHLNFLTIESRKVELHHRGEVKGQQVLDCSFTAVDLLFQTLHTHIYTYA